jgi:hypothetical protein
MFEAIVEDVGCVDSRDLGCRVRAVRDVGSRERERESLEDGNNFVNKKKKIPIDLVFVCLSVC